MFTVYAIFQRQLLVYHINTTDYIEFEGTLQMKNEKLPDVPLWFSMTRREGKWFSQLQNEDLLKQLTEAIEWHFKQQL